MWKSGVVLCALVLLLAGTADNGHADARQQRHLIYLHGRIVQEQQSNRPKHPQYGYYELDEILRALRDRGFVVSGEIRPRHASVNDAAERVVAQVRRLLASGVPADHITVVGASMGAGIALRAAAKLQNPDVRFCVLGACLSENVSHLVADEGKAPRGHLLSIRESSDEATGGCPSWRHDPDATKSAVVHEIVLNTGLNHGFIYKPLPEWVNPVVEWAGGST